MARAWRWAEVPHRQRATFWWGIAWTALNIGIVLMIVLLASG